MSTIELSGFDTFDFTHDGLTMTVYRRGKGPGIVLMHEIPGITPQVKACAERITDAGFTVFMPWMFGTPGKPLSIPYVLGQMLRAVCMRKEFVCLSRGRSSPITDWLRALARQVHAELGGPGVGAMGMCLTGGFALTMMLDRAVIAPVLSQPSLPMLLPGLAKKNAAEIDIAPQDLDRVAQRLRDEDLTVLGLRFTEDAFCPKARFDMLRQKLGERFEAVEIDSSPGNLHGFGKTAHSVLTVEFKDEADFPTRKAMDRVIGFFRERLVIGKAPAESRPD